MKDIETLLNKYFEGETTCEEERRLRRFFAEGLVPEHLLPDVRFLRSGTEGTCGNLR